MKEGLEDGASGDGPSLPMKEGLEDGASGDGPSLLPAHSTSGRGEGRAAAAAPPLGRCRKGALPTRRGPLYATLFCSVAAVTLSIRTHLSTSFVELEEPLRAGAYFRRVDHIGLSTWELCALRQDALNSIVVDDGVPISTVVTTTDLWRNATSRVRTVYHRRGGSGGEPGVSWMEEPDHDDVLVSGDFPYNDDDAYEMDLPDDYWTCHRLRIASRSAGSDAIWNASRAFFALGSIVGISSTGLLIALIILRERDAKRRTTRLRQEARRKSITIRRNDGRSEVSEREMRSNEILSLDTNSSGYRPISACFLLSYLMQSLTLLFLDSQICKDQICTLSTGAHSLLASCVLWVVSGLLVLFAMKEIRRNEIRVRRLKKRSAAAAERQDSSETLLHATSEDAGVQTDTEKGDVRVLRGGDALSGTMETECSDFSSLGNA